MPPQLSDFKDGYDSFGRPQRVNLQTISEFYGNPNNIIAVDRLMLAETSRRMPLFPHQRLLMQEAIKRQFLFTEILRGGAKCRKADSLVTLADGREVTAGSLVGTSFSIPSLTNADKLVSLFAIQGHNVPLTHRTYCKTLIPSFGPESNEVTNSLAFAEDNGIKPCVRVEATCGATVEVTTNHPFLTLRGWTPASELLPGDTVAVTTRTSAQGTKPMDINIVKFLAYMLADGGTTCNGATFAQLPGPQLEEFREVCSALGVDVVPTGKAGCTYRLRCTVRATKNSSVITKILSEYGLKGKHSRDKRIPRQIFECPNDQLQIFFSRYMACDGFATVGTTGRGVRGRRGKPSIGLCSISRGMVRDMKRLALRLGVLGRTYGKTCKKSTANGMAYYWTVTGAEQILRYAENIGIFGKERAVERCRAIAQASSDSNKCKKLPHPDFTWSSIKSVEDIGSHPTVAIEVPQHHTFVDEFVEHNTSTVGRFVLDYCLQQATTPAILTGPSFRQALMMFDEIVKLIEMNDRNANAPVRLSAEIVGEIKRNTMESVIRFKNGSSIKAVPMGTGEKIRGLRGGLLIIDEFYQMTEEMHSSHVLPFAAVKQGGRESKVIYITTSWYTDCFAYRRLMQMASEVKAGNTSYGILDFNLEDLVETGFPLSEGIWKDARRHQDPVTFAMTYYNVWPSSQARWYEQPVLDKAQSVEQGVRIELKRDPASKDSYFAIIDLAASEKGDSTVALVAKWNTELQRAEFVYGTRAKGLGPSERAWIVHEIRKKFNPAFIIYDAHGAIGVDLRKDLAKSEIYVNGSLHKVTPLVHHDAYNLRGEHCLIPIAVNDKAIKDALVGPRDGTTMGGEAKLKELLHTKARDLLFEGKLVGPAAAFEGKDDDLYLGSEIEALDTIREAFAQLADIGLKKDKLGHIVRTADGSLLFETRPGFSDDGAHCVIYAAVGVLRNLGYGQPETRPGAVTSPMLRPNSFQDVSTEGVNIQKLSWQ